MDPLTLSRIQFAATAAFHFMLVPLTLGLSVLVAMMETQYVRTGKPVYLRMTKFWGKLFLINFALGVVTGISMEFQFGMNWAEYSRYVGDIFGAPLAIEATVAFFLESVFIGVWIFGWKRVSKGWHLFSIWIVAFATNLSALWILIANGWMQRPVGYVLKDGRAEMVDFSALLLNTFGWTKFIHTVSSGYVIGAFFVMGISAYHLLRKREIELFTISFRMAAPFALVSCISVAILGDIHAVQVARYQPTKFAAMESVWETRKGAPLNLISLPDPANERNTVEALGIPKLLSFLAFHDFDAEIKGLKAFPNDERPPVHATYWPFKLMVGLGMTFMLLATIGVWHSRREGLEDKTLLLRAMLWCIPLPYLAAQLGWIVSEVGRQPWIVYGLLKTSKGVSKSITTEQVLGSLIGFVLLYGLLLVVDLYLLTYYAKRGPVGSAGGPVQQPDLVAQEA